MQFRTVSALSFFEGKGSSWSVILNQCVRKTGDVIGPSDLCSHSATASAGEERRDRYSFRLEQYRTLDNRITGAGCCSLGAHTPVVRSLRLVVRATNAVS